MRPLGGEGEVAWLPGASWMPGICLYSLVRDEEKGLRLSCARAVTRGLAVWVWGIRFLGCSLGRGQGSQGSEESAGGDGEHVEVTYAWRCL